jgi:two-component system, cell cycle sensor histidine kinase and response regulator CckA
MHRDIDSALAELVLHGLGEAVVVLDTRGSIAAANRIARQRPEVARLFAQKGSSPPLDAFLEQLRAHGTARAEVCADEGTALVLEGSARRGYFVILVRDAPAQSAPDRDQLQLEARASLALVATSLVHDINNALTPVLLLSARLATDLEGDAPRAAIAAEVHAAATLATALMRDVLSLSRPRTPRIERIDVKRVVTGRLGLIARILGAGVEIDHVLDEDVGDVLVDRAGFEHALLNLVANARDAMPGGGRVTLAAHVAEDGGRPCVSVSVTDTGIGMTDDVRRRAFETFFTTKGDSGGTGVGLASVDRFARQSGGHATLESEPMKGTTATLVLPRATPCDPPKVPRPRAVAAGGCAEGGERSDGLGRLPIHAQHRLVDLPVLARGPRSQRG